MEPIDLLVRNAREVLTMDGPPPDPSRPHDVSPLGLITDGAVACARGRVVAVGPSRELERAVVLAPGGTVLDAAGCVVAPGLMDCHTHALFAGDRAGEFAARLEGRSYAEIAAAGGGIARSVEALRGSDDGALATALEARLARMRGCGVTTVEVKSGYGLDARHELRSLALARGARATRTRATFLGLHAVAPELRGSPGGRAEHLRRVRDEILPRVIEQRAADFIDAYVDSAGFSPDEVRETLARARAAGLGVRLHVGQFDDVGGAELAAELGALSADHLEHLSDAGARAMAAAGTVAVVLPGAAFSLGQRYPDARRMRSLGLEVAVATDCNPGTSYTENLTLMVAMAVRCMGLSLVEGWWSVTRAAARALAMPDAGVLRPGALADLCVLDLASWQGIAYRFGLALARDTVVGGRAYPGVPPGS